MRLTTALTALFSLLSATTALAQLQVPNCLPTDVECFMTKAQYTVLGTITSNNANSTDPGASPANYNATMLIQCVYASFGNNKGTGANMANNQLTVTGFGFPNPNCPPNTGAQAIVNSSSIYFIYVATSVPQGGMPIYTVFNPCGGGIPFSDENLNKLGAIVAKNPQNAIPPANQGNPAKCTLPTPTPVSTIAPTATGSNKPLELPSNAVVIPQWTVLSVVGAIFVTVLTVVLA
ncbi:uncharacterized protein SPPG_03767 [Spizellomyces punctatus DAOM BR117]|uniref:Uncharacterized protein n=1 Tax=Spizellomyces punctatus (strain DAOM BR117) TaxID=645134 RepID=A0A0L0HGP8_SPIPD|nr:uncharacterized protein SPPG_03767 [Spizellomyces punctatus DAOM BR117]KND00641.1 hypothetical protein SPPG_03767 [Spizellomyces punctatus DAOM BR117]|eukprot:XP_016608680.1 hypothetical protein SPPG_03767 [Spizellomyces punctatus DAOM BR117]